MVKTLTVTGVTIPRAGLVPSFTPSATAIPGKGTVLQATAA